MNDLNKKAFVILTLVAMMCAATPLANSQPAPPTLSVTTSKLDYAPGETGILYLDFHNDAGSAVTVKKVYIVFTSWRAYIKNKWEGNLTIVVNQAVASRGVFENETRFTVPSDGRARDTQVIVTVETEERGDFSYYGSVSVPPTPRYMDQIVTLLTVLLALVIVCTVILAAAIFLSARRPQVTWSKEEKVP